MVSSITNKYKHLFFDLDHTLWDFETNSRLTLHEIHEKFQLINFGIAASEFIEKYEINNNKMWQEYRLGKMSQATLRLERFRQTLSQLGVKNKELSATIGEYYVAHSPKKTHLFPSTHDTLTYLGKRYKLHIITNGFEEVQYQKLVNSALKPYFAVIVTSEQTGCKKPHPAIFEYALKHSKANPEDSVMIGDNQKVDIEAAQKIGIDGVLFNPNNEPLTVTPKYHIQHLSELIKIF